MNKKRTLSTLFLGVACSLVVGLSPVNAGGRNKERVAVVIGQHGSVQLERAGRRSPAGLLAAINAGDVLSVKAGADVVVTRTADGTRYQLKGPCHVRFSGSGEPEKGPQVVSLPEAPAREAARVGENLDLKGFGGSSSRSLANTSCYDRDQFDFDEYRVKSSTPFVVTDDGTGQKVGATLEAVDGWDRKRWRLVVSGGAKPGRVYVLRFPSPGASSEREDDLRPVIFTLLTAEELSGVRALEASARSEPADQLELYSVFRTLHLYERAEALLDSWQRTGRAPLAADELKKLRKHFLQDDRSMVAQVVDV